MAPARGWRTRAGWPVPHQWQRHTAPGCTPPAAVAKGPVTPQASAPLPAAIEGVLQISSARTPSCIRTCSDACPNRTQASIRLLACVRMLRTASSRALCKALIYSLRKTEHIEIPAHLRREQERRKGRKKGENKGEENRRNLLTWKRPRRVSPMPMLPSTAALSACCRAATPPLPPPSAPKAPAPSAGVSAAGSAARPARQDRSASMWRPAP